MIKFGKFACFVLWVWLLLVCGSAGFKGCAWASGSESFESAASQSSVLTGLTSGPGPADHYSSLRVLGIAEESVPAVVGHCNYNSCWDNVETEIRRMYVIGFYDTSVCELMELVYGDESCLSPVELFRVPVDAGR